jgi:hypothetical protein
MMTSLDSDSREFRPTIRRGRVDSLSLFEITEQELETLAAGSPHSTYLNFAIAFLSAGLAFFTSLLTAVFSSNRTFTVFVVITTVGTAAGVVLLFVWYQTKSSVDEVIARIKQRVPPEESDSSMRAAPVVGDPESSEG